MLGGRERDRLHRPAPGSLSGAPQRQTQRAAPNLRHRPRRHHSGGPQGAQQLCQRQVRASRLQAQRQEMVTDSVGSPWRQTNKPTLKEGKHFWPTHAFLLTKQSEALVWKKKKKKRLIFLFICLQCVFETPDFYPMSL